MAALVTLEGSGDGGRRPDIRPLPRTECDGPILGVHSTLAFQGDPERRAATVARIDDTLDAQVVRDNLLWHQIERVQGERDWSRLDSLLEELREAGIEPMLAAFGSPSWANGVPESAPGHHLHVPARGAPLDAWLERYSDFLSEAVRRYRRVVRRWEVWNEPNLAVFWRPRPDPIAYRRVYEKLRATILAADPTAEVAVGGLAALAVARSPDISGARFLRALSAVRAPLDHVAIHPYTTEDHPPDVHVPGENNFDDIQLIRDQLRADGEPAPIWVTEWGWSSAAVGERRQARYVDRSLEMLEGRYRYVRVATYFSDHDRPPELLQGLLAADLEPKPAARAFRRHADLATSRCHVRVR